MWVGNDNLRAALFMMGAMAGYAFGDAAIKLMGGHLPLAQILTLRGILTICLVGTLALRAGAFRFDLRGRDWAIIALRSASEVAATYFFLTALLNMNFANLMAILQSLPLLVTLGSALFFGERVGWRRWTAIALGFCGMLLIVRPGPDGFELASVYALAAVLSVTLRDLITRGLSAEVPSLTVTCVAAIAVTSFGAAWSVFVPWEPVTPWLALLLVAAAGLILCGYLFSIMAMRCGDVAFVAPFRYTGLLWALLLGFVLFGEWPTSLTLLGAAIVVATGLFTLLREARQRQRP